ncbi:hypothetical protein [uncultured Draconibacterium sp.]|uniref:hypothetical protein n=1 Tax=uncultured Draconibacterium sp. TaxID=1573823 RepID=UPI0029C93D69|nr:hypothetical protein [uncultured Draconibacterium sp.]
MRFLFYFFLTFSFSACALIGLNDENRCTETEADAFELGILPNTYVVYQNGEPCKDYDIKFEVYKTYCDGDISGQYSTEAKTNDEGYAHFGEQYRYKFANTDDKVTFAYIVTYGTKHIVEKVITYNLALDKSLSMGTEDRYMELYIDFFDRAPIVVPWNPN